MGEEVIEVNKYYDWWFDNAIEFLGYLLEDKLKIKVNWEEDKISFEKLNDKQIKHLIGEIERLIDYKLKYKKVNKKTQIKESKLRTYLPAIHNGKYVGILKKIKEKDKIFNTKIDFLSKNIKNMKNSKICDVCGNYYTPFDKNINKLTQIVYPSTTTSLKSLCGIRKPQPENTCCIKCAFLGSIEWLDDYPFISVYGTSSNKHCLLFPLLNNLQELHKFKNIMRNPNTGIFEQKEHSNILNSKSTDSYSLLLNIYEKLYEKTKIIRELDKILCDDWVELEIKNGFFYVKNLKIPNLERLKKIFESMFYKYSWFPYSNFIKYTFAKPLKSGNINNDLSNENQYLMSKGILMDDFKTFAKAFQIRKGCIVGFKRDIGNFKDKKDKLNIIMESWRGI